MLTNHHVGIEFLGNGHHHFLEGEHVIAIAHTLVGPWNIDISKKRETLAISFICLRKNSLSDSGA